MSKDAGDKLAAELIELRDYGRRPNRSEHDSAWRNPRDDERDPQPFQPGMDRNSIGTNVPAPRKGE